MRLFTTYLIGLVFGVGIMISGMANPAKVLNFFDFAGSWDPSLIFVMGGALVTTFIGYRFVLPRQQNAQPVTKPLMDVRFHLPTKRSLDARLIGGSALFGIGWGIAGFCPGGALPALGTGIPAVFTFSAALLAGIFLAKFAMKLVAGRATPTASPTQ